jgi:hypothetical protein
MAKYSIVALTALLITGFGAPCLACAQAAADLSAPGVGGNFSATGMSPNLSASNRAVPSGASGGGNGLKAQTRSALSARFSSITSGPPTSLPSTSQPSYRGRSYEMLQATAILPLQAKPKPAGRGFAAAYPSISAPRLTGFGRSSQLTPPASHSPGVSSSSLQTPVYSFLVRNDKEMHSGASQLGLLRKLNHMKNSNGSPMRSLSGLRSSGGSHR